MHAAAQQSLPCLAASLSAVLRRDAEALTGDGAADLERLAGQLDALLAFVAAHPDDPGVQRTLLQVLTEVEAFHGRIQAAHAATRDALHGMAERQVAGRAYGEARRYGVAGEAA